MTTSSEPPVQPFIHLARSAESHPDALALLGARLSLTYSELKEHSTRLALYLLRCGIRTGDRVGLQLDLDLHVPFAFALWAIGAEGGILPASLDRLALPHLDWCLSQDPELVRVADAHLDVDDAFATAAANERGALDIATYREGESCRMLFSSGTTGTPKALGVSVDQIERRRTIYDAWTPAYPAFSIISMTSGVGVHALVNAAATASPYYVPRGPAENFDVIEQEAVGSIICSVAQLDALCSVAERRQRPLGDLGAILVGGATIPPSLVSRVRALSDAQIVAVYATSETGPIATGSFDDEGTVRYHRPSHEVDVRTIDERGAEGERGAAGRLALRTPWMVNGYLDDPQSAAFVDGWFVTDDLGEISADSSFTVVGRASHVVNIGGVKIDPDRLEDVARSVAGVSDAAFVVLDSPLGPAGLLAVVSDDEASAAAAGDAVRSASWGVHLDGVFRMPAIPRTEMGKVQRNEIADRWRRATEPNH